MKILVIGSGGREHCLTWKIAQSDRVKEIFCAPGNGGTDNLAKNIHIAPGDIKALSDFAQEQSIDLTVVGPELPLVRGIVDEFQKRRLKIFGPKQELALLEGSKVFAKKTMARFSVPSADFCTFNDQTQAANFIHEKNPPLVVKADGLAAGKGVFVCGSIEEAELALKTIMVEKKFGESGTNVVIEDCLQGEEASVLVFCDGKNVIPLASSQDHKRIYDGDHGPNCYSEDTEILTDHGWKRFDSLETKDKVAVFEPRYRKIYFERPLKKYWMDYKGTMIHFEHRNIDLLVTPNHRMLVQQRKGKRKTFAIEAKDFRGENYVYQSGKWSGENSDFFILPEHDYKFNRKFKKLKIKFIDWVRFLGIYLAEGSTTKAKWSKRVYISQTKRSQNFNKIKKMISKLPFKFTYEEKSHKFRINSTQLAVYLSQFGSSHIKYVPDYIKQAKRKIILEFLKAFNLGDGDVHNGKMRFFSSSRRLIDDIQEMIVKLDCSGVITTDKRKTMVNPLNQKTYKASPIHSIEMKNRNKTSIRKYNIRRVKYRGKIGCVTVSTGFVLVRRNNRVAISGNTGGMGAYSPAPCVTDVLAQEVNSEILQPLVTGLNNEGKVYTGVLYLGLMITETGPKLLEFNVRFGDPETQAILPRLKNDLVEVILATIEGNLDKISLVWDSRVSICVVIASGGYPQDYEKGKEISGLQEAEKFSDVFVFHAGTKKENEKYLSSGGRVLNIVSLGDDLAQAQQKVYQAIEKIKFEKMYFRRDIGWRALK